MFQRDVLRSSPWVESRLVYFFKGKVHVCFEVIFVHVEGPVSFPLSERNGKR